VFDGLPLAAAEKMAKNCKNNGVPFLVSAGMVLNNLKIIYNNITN
jgi:hypothetical protein